MYFNLKLGISKVGGYSFPHSCDGPRKSRLSFKWPLVETEFGVPGLHDDDLNLNIPAGELRIGKQHRI
jgi:hypothetical protein